MLNGKARLKIARTVVFLFLTALTLTSAAPTDPLEMVRQNLLHHRPEEAVELARKASERKLPHSNTALLDALWHDDRIDEAFSLLRQLEQRNKPAFEPYWTPRFYVLRGSMEEFLQHHLLARKNYSEALRQAPKGSLAEFQARSKLAAYQSSDEPLNALSFTYIPDQDPELDAVLLKAQASRAQEKGQWETALRLWQSLERLHRSRNNPAALGRTLLRQAEIYRRHESHTAVRNCLARADQIFSQQGDARGFYDLQILEDHIDFETRIRRLDTVPPGPGKVKLMLASLEGEEAETTLLDQAQLEADRLAIDRLRTLVETERAWHVWGRKQSRASLLKHLHKAAELTPKSEVQIPEFHWLHDTDSVKVRVYVLLNSPGALTRLDGYQELATSLAGSREHTRTRIRVLGDIIYFALRELELDLALKCFEEAVEEIPKLHHPPARIRALRRITEPLTEVSLSSGLEPNVLLSNRHDPVNTEFIARLSEKPELLNRLLDQIDDVVQWSRKNKQPQHLVRALLLQAQFFELLGLDQQSRDSALESLSTSLGMRDSRVVSRARRVLARLALAQDDSAEALSLLRQRVEADSKDYSARDDLVLFSLALGQPEQALAYIEPLIGAPSFTRRALFIKSHALLRLGRATEAKRVLDKRKSRIEEKNGGSSPYNTYLEAKIQLSLGHPERSVTLLRNLKADNPAARRDVSLELGRALEELGKVDEALAIYRKEIQDLLAFKGGLRAWQHEVKRQRRTETLFERAIALAEKQGKYEEALQFAEASSSLRLLTSLQSGSGRSLISLDRLGQRIAQLKQLENKNSGPEKLAIQSALAQTQEEFSRVMTKLKANPNFEKVVTLQTSHSRRIRQRLKPGEAAVQYYVTPAVTYLMVLTSDKIQIVSVRVSRHELWKLVGQLRGELRNRASQPSDSDERLWKVLLAPIQDILKDYDHLCILPSEDLWSLPLECLRDSDGKWADERWTFSYSSSSELLSRTSQQRGATALFIGQGLPGASQEVQELKDSVRLHSTLLKDSDATVERFKKEAPLNDMIHIATHSLWQPGGRSYIEFFDQRLELAQLSALQLKQNSLVILSSCQSALDKGKVGREPSSLALAFLGAGASQVVASNWRVDDAKTLHFFRHFYEALAKGEDVPSALQLARFRLRENPETSHPYYWAPFTLHGVPR